MEIAFGLNLNFTSWFIVMSDYFQKRYATVFSLTQSGVGLGMFVFGPLFTLTISQYGWRGAMLLTGGCALQFTVLGALVLVPRKPKDKIQTDGANEELLPIASAATLRNTEIEETSRVVTSQPVNPANSGAEFNVRKDWRAWFMHLSCFFWLLATSILYILMADYARSISLEE